jgi:hypothetical protein
MKSTRMFSLLSVTHALAFLQLGMTEDTGVGTAPATTDTTSASSAPIEANFDKNVDIKPVKFNFRKVKDETLGTETKRPSVELQIPTPSVEGVIAILQKGGKGLELLLDAVSAVVIARAKTLVDEDETITQDKLKVAELTWEAIANLPQAERRGGGIPKETWEDFAADYIEVMPALTGKTIDQVTNATKAYINKFAALKTNKPAINVLKQQLALYAAHSPNVEQYTDCLQFLVEKADKLLSLSDDDYTANL